MKEHVITRNGKKITQVMITCADKTNAGISKYYHRAEDRKREEMAVKRLMNGRTFKEINDEYLKKLEKNVP